MSPPRRSLSYATIHIALQNHSLLCMPWAAKGFWMYLCKLLKQGTRIMDLHSIYIFIYKCIHINMQQVLSFPLVGHVVHCRVFSTIVASKHLTCLQHTAKPAHDICMYVQIYIYIVFTYLCLYISWILPFLFSLHFVSFLCCLRGLLFLQQLKGEKGYEL